MSCLLSVMEFDSGVFVYSELVWQHRVMDDEDKQAELALSTILSELKSIKSAQTQIQEQVNSIQKKGDKSTDQSL